MVPQPTTPPAPTEATSEGSAEGRDLAGAVVSGLKWSVATQVVGEGTRVVVAVLLARLLTPADYGVAGMAVVCASFASVLMDPALVNALIQRPRITEADRSTVFWTMVALGSLGTVVGIALSGVVADIFGQPQVQELFAALSIGFVITSLGATQAALMTRELAYRSLQIRQIGATILGGITAVIVAEAGFGPWAIVANQLAFVTAATVLLWRLSPWRPHATFSGESLRDLGGFGTKVFGANVVSWANLNVDNALVGRYLGAAALGAYALAYNVMFVPMVRVGIPLAQVLSPAYARMQHDPGRLERAWLKSKRVSASVLAPAFLAVMVVAPDLIHVAFGSKWDASIKPLQLLCIAGVAYTLVTLNWGVLQAMGKVGTLFRVQVIQSVLSVAAFVAGLKFGIVGVAGFYAVARWLLVFIDIRLTTRAVSFDFKRALRAGTGSLPLGLAAAALGFGLRQLLIAEGASPAVRLVVVALTIGAVYLALLFVVAPSLFADVWQVLRRTRPPEPSVAAS